ncbi:HipA domain-containing protein [Shewanella aestuarii]|uniref:HipA domain-containing protein n=1 Tax=Shewanella aestuarii TaxID=1028752 RepID=A0A6G9QRY8_9GAMM|nr:HipA domain-containing protein [Shewanella aestuarii]QIR16551.1 HipA domain-containing protein [Shewanella aestuarii]
MLGIYFVGINIDKFSAKRKCDKGDIIRYQSGIYFDNELSGSATSVELAKNIKRLEQSVRHYAPWIVTYLNPNSTLVAASAYFKTASDDTTIFIDGVTNGRKSAIGSKILDDYPQFDADVSIKIERIRLQNQLKESEIVSAKMCDDNINMLVGVQHNPQEEQLMRDRFDEFKIKYTTFERTLTDIVRWDKNDPRSLNDIDLIAFLSDHDVDLTTLSGASLFRDKLAETVYPMCSNSQTEQLKDRLNNILMNQSDTGIYHALKRMNFKHEAKSAKQIFDVYHFNDKKLKLYNIDGTKWAASGDHWVVPLENGSIGHVLPNTIAGLLPEIHKLDNNNYGAFFSKSSRFLSNIQIIEQSKPLGFFDYHTHFLTDGEVFHGEVVGIPDFEDRFTYNMCGLAMSEGMPKISGVQMKVPMNLDSSGERMQLTVALNKPFTHILKVPGIDQQNFVMGEWFGLKAVEHTGASSVSKFQIAEIRQGSITSYGLVSERFDISHDKSKKLRAIDMLSLHDFTNDEKYGKPSEMIFKCIDMFPANKAQAKSDAYKLVVSSVILANTDLHLKNISFLKDERFGQVRENETACVAPFYDVVVSTVMPGYEHQKQALSINNTFYPETTDLIRYGMDMLEITEAESKKRLETLCWDLFTFAKNCRRLYPEVAEIRPLRHAMNICIETVLSNVVKYAPSLKTGQWVDVGAEYKQIAHTDLEDYKLLPDMNHEALVRQQQKEALTEKVVPFKYQAF